MTATLYFSNRIEKLADRLAENLRRSYQTVDPFMPIRIIVPNTNLTKWLQLALCRRQSVVFNLQFVYLEEGLAEMISETGHAKAPDQIPRVELSGIDQRSLQVFFALKTMALDQPELAPVSRYLFDGNGSPRPDYALRIWQLSGRLARLFQEYEYHREELIQNWLHGGPEDRKERRDAALCQSTIYRWMYHRSAKINAAVTFNESFFDFVSKRWAELEKRGGHIPDAPWHFFGLSHLSRFHLKLIHRLQPFFSMHLYTLNPCREFWEDIPSATELRYQSKKGRDLADFPVEHELLSAWGRPGRETMEMLCQLTDYEIQEDFSKHFPETVLGRLQQSFLTLRAPDLHDRLPQDRSIQIAACPGRRREVETVHNAILHNLTQQDDLQLTDIAVLVSDMAEYLPYIELVFNGAFRQITYNLVDSGAYGQSYYGQAVLSLFDLVESQLNRKAVFAFLQNPCVMHRFNITRTDVTHWAEWVTALGIFRSPEDGSDTKSPRALATCLFSWQQGLLRLRLGHIFTAATHDGPTPVEHFQGVEPYTDIQSSDPDAVEHFCLVMETLFRVCDRLRQPLNRAEEWSEQIQWACRKTMSIPGMFPDEGGVQRKLYDALTDLAQYDQGNQGSFKETTPALGFQEMKHYLKMVVGNINGGQGDYLTSGVTIAELAPMRPIPFKVIFVLGLEAGRFPGRSDMSSLDVRRKKRQPGDVTLPERQRYLFLEMLLSVREKLYLTYVSRDLDKDRDLAPGSLLIQLSHYIENYLLLPGSSFEIQQIPLNGFSAQYYDTDSINSKTDFLSNQSLSDRLAGYGFYDLWPQVFEKAGGEERLTRYGFDPLWQSPEERLPTAEIAPSRDNTLHEDLGNVTLDELRWFLLDPVNQSTQRRLGPVDRDALRTLLIETDEEPLHTGFPFGWQIAMTVLNRLTGSFFLNTGPSKIQNDMAAVFDEIYARFTRQNRVPRAPFAAADKKALLSTLRETTANIQNLLSAVLRKSKKYRRICLGDEQRHDGGAIGQKDRLDCPATVLEFPRKYHSQPMSAAIVGSADFIWQDEEKQWHIVVPAALECKPPKFPKQLINAALFCFAAKAGNLPQFKNTEKANLYLAAVNGIFRSQLTVDTEQAQAYLSHLMAEYVTPRPPHWLPWQILQSLTAGPFDGQNQPSTETPQHDFKQMLINAFDSAPPGNRALVETETSDASWDRAVRRFGVFPRLEKFSVDNL